MRKENWEYNFDWMLWSAFTAASRLKSGTEKEYRTLLKYIPSFRDILDILLSLGKPGQTLVETASKYMVDL